MPAPQKSAARTANALRSKSGGRRVSDRLKPLLAKVVSVVSSDSINEAFFNLTDDMREFFECETFVIYSVNSDKTQLFSRNQISDEVVEKRIDIAKCNLPGYVFITIILLASAIESTFSLNFSLSLFESKIASPVLLFEMV